MQHYRENREGATPAAGLAQRMESWMHRVIASDVRGGMRLPTLEIGAGSLNHLSYEPASEPYDIVEPFTELLVNRSDRARVRHVYGDIAEVPASARYGRILSIATFEHICALPQVVARCGLLLTDDACLRVAIPSEGEWSWRLDGDSRPPGNSGGGSVSITRY